MLGELVQVALTVRDEPELQAVRAKHLQHRQRVFVEGEVLVPLPLANHLGGARARAGGVAAHADDDPLGEGDPDLLVVNEPLSPLQLVDRVEPRLVVAGGIELEPVPPPTRRYPSGPSSGPGRESVKSTSNSTARSTARGTAIARAAGSEANRYEAGEAGSGLARRARLSWRRGGWGSALRSGRRGPQFKSGALRPSRGSPGCATPSREGSVRFGRH